MAQVKDKVHDFESSLKKGKKAEAEFFELFKDKLERLDGFINDFRIKATGETIELKLETRCTSETPNIFVERYSYKDVNGGPYQAAEKGSTYYIHFFPKTMEFFCYRTTKLVAWLNANMPRPWLFNIRNKTHVTRGFVVRREALKDLELDLEEVLNGQK